MKDKKLRVLFIGDIVGEAGRNAIGTLVAGLVKEYQADFIIANCENSAGGKGVTPKITEYLR